MACLLIASPPLFAPIPISSALLKYCLPLTSNFIVLLTLELIPLYASWSLDSSILVTNVNVWALSSSGELLKVNNLLLES